MKTTDLPPLIRHTTESKMTYEERRAAREADTWWLWRLIEYTPDHLAWMEQRLASMGYTLEEEGPSYFHSKGCKEWKPPKHQSYVFNYALIDGEWIITSHVWDRYYHDLDPCAKCGQVVDATTVSTDGYCWTCNHWRKRLTETRPTPLVIDNPQYGPTVYSDAGDKPNVRPADKSHMGFGGHRFYIEAIDGSRSWSTNNLYMGGEVPPAWLAEFPITHRFSEPPHQKDTTP